MTEQEEMKVEQMRMERYIQPSGIEVKLRLLEIPEGLVGHPYTVEREVSGEWQSRRYGMMYGKAMEAFGCHRDFEKRIGSLFTLLGDADVD